MALHLDGFLLRVKALFFRRRLNRDMADELAFHQAMLKERLSRQGTPQDLLETATRRQFGNSSRWHERLREVWQFRSLENFGRDVSYSARVLRKSPGFSLVAIITLALGVGANTTVFSMINGLLLRPLPVPESNRLCVLGIERGRPRLQYSFSDPLFRGLERQQRVFSQIFAFNHMTAQVRGNSGTENVSGQLVSGEFFSALQTAPLLGRTLTAVDDSKGGNPHGFAVVISESFWQNWFKRRPDVVGQKLQIDNVLFTVAGVMPKSFIGADPLQRPELFVPLAAEPAIDGARSMTAAGFHAWWLTVMGRLKPQTTLEEANAQVAASSNTILHEVIPDANWVATQEKRHFVFQAESGSTGFTYVRLLFRKPLMAVFAMCGGILLLACLNLASLLMARGAARQKGLATRLAMGATRRRLMQQLLVESLMIAVIGTATGLAFAPVVSQALASVLLGGQFETHVDTSLDLRVFAFAALAAILATLLVGLVPAFQATSKTLNEQMKNGQHSTRSYERQGLLPRAIMASEVALALMLVVGAGLLASSVVRLYRSGVGFDPSGIQNITLSMDLQPLKGDALMQFYRQLGDGLGHQPGVKSVTFARIVPFSNVQWDEEFSVAGGKSYDIYENSVGPDYFKTMRIPLFDGREFRWTDTTSSGPRIILNQTAARLLFSDQNPIGQFVKKQEGDKTIQYQVIGVAGNAKYEDLRSTAPPTGYLAMTQLDDSRHASSYTAVVRAEGPVAPLAGAARSLVNQADPSIPAPVMTSMEETVRDSLSAERTMAMLAVFFGVCALVVTAIGLYGTLAYATARRTSEIGIRMALGARRTQVTRMVFAQNAAVALIGTAVGLFVALLASRALASFLYSTSTRDPWVFAGSIMVLALIASAASLLPAIRAARINPMIAIRCE
jgi:predicted permease